jgi:hypothetical protein
LIANAHALPLPIGYGGGSNVKTAEALAAGRPIVATGAAFRGFDEYRSLPSVTLADTPLAFEAAIRANPFPDAYDGRTTRRPSLVL